MNLYQHLSRVMTKGRDFVPQIDGLRFVAITAVLAYHIRAIIARHYGVNGSPAGTDGLVNWTFGAGCKGVELFFAISGFILGVTFARHSECVDDAAELIYFSIIFIQPTILMI